MWFQDECITACVRYMSSSLFRHYSTRSSASAEEPRDALCQLKSCQLLHNCATNRILKGLRQVHDLEGHTRCSHSHCSIGHTLLPITGPLTTYLSSSTDSKILPLLQSTWLPVNLRSPSVSIRQLKLQPTRIFRFILNHIVANTCYILTSMGVRKVSNKKVTVKITQGH